MTIVRMLAMIFLAAFLILTGISELSEVMFSPMARLIVNLCALASGVLIFVSFGKCNAQKK